MLGPTVLDPFVRPRPLKAGFGRNQNIGRIRMKRLGDEALGHYGPVGVSGVDEIDSQLQCMLQDSDRLGVVGRFSPYASTGQLHRTEAEPANRNVAADQECLACFSRATVTRAR